MGRSRAKGLLFWVLLVFLWGLSLLFASTPPMGREAVKAKISKLRIPFIKNQGQVNSDGAITISGVWAH